MEFIGIIPSRFASTRFPGKPLVDINGKIMIQRVYEQAKKALTHVFVATDDERIYDAVKNFGGEVIMTSTEHQSGTDRCNEAIEKAIMLVDVDVENLVVINIQGDEPFIQPQQLQRLMQCFDNAETQIATLIKPTTNPEEIFNPNCVRVIVDVNHFALYFTRATVPYLRNVAQEKWHENYKYNKHIGIYSYRYEVLKQIAQLPQSPLEKAESLEQLRWLENGFRINTATTDFESIAIDTPQDLEKLKNLTFVDD